MNINVMLFIGIAKSSLVSLNKRKTDNISDRYSSTLQLQAQQIFTEIGT